METHGKAYLNKVEDGHVRVDIYRENVMLEFYGRQGLSHQFKRGEAIKELCASQPIILRCAELFGYKVDLREFFLKVDFDSLVETIYLDIVSMTIASKLEWRTTDIDENDRFSSATVFARPGFIGELVSELCKKYQIEQLEAIWLYGFFEETFGALFSQVLGELDNMYWTINIYEPVTRNNLLSEFWNLIAVAMKMKNNRDAGGGGIFKPTELLKPQK